MATGREAKKDLKTVTKEVKNDNQDKIEISTHKSGLEAKINEATKTVINSITEIRYTNICPPDFAGMRNETAGESAGLHVHGLE